MSLKSRGLQKLVRGSLEIGKYAGYATVLAGLGCFRSPNYISVSEDGRYVAVPVNREGEFKFESEEDGFADVLIMDTQALMFKIPMRFYDGFNLEDSFCLTNSRDKIAYMNDDSGESSSVFVLSMSGREVITQAGFPKLFDGGNRLAYSKILGKEGDDYKLDIVLRNLKTGHEDNLGIDGMVSDFSPDAEHFVYMFEKKVGEEREAYIGLNEVYGKNVLNVKDVDFLGGFPQWIDNERVLFRSKSKKSENSEVFVVNLKGDLEKITTNSFGEIYPQAIGDRIFFGVSEDDDDEMIPIYFAEKKDGEWKTEDTNIKTKSFFRVTDKNDIVYIDERNHIMRRHVKRLPVKGEVLMVGGDDYTIRSAWRGLIKTLSNISEKKQIEQKLKKQLD